MADNKNREEQPSKFAEQAEAKSTGLVAEFVAFLSENKAWWLTPIIICLLVLGALLLIGPAASPFIYTLF